MEIVYVLSILLLAVASSSLDHNNEWKLWKTRHGKWYSSMDEEMERQRVWLANREYIEKHNANADSHGYTLALNHFGDLVYGMQMSCYNYVALSIPH